MCQDSATKDEYPSNMPTLTSNADFMQLALAQGRLALPDCLPNPPVGCVLVNSGVDKVFVGLLDPDPRNSGAGIRMLRDAGITVVVGLLAEEAAEDLADFLVSNCGGSLDRNDQQIVSPSAQGGMPGRLH